MNTETQYHTDSQRVAVLGASGSIGSSALDVIAASEGRLTAQVLTVHTDVARLLELTHRFHPQTVIISGKSRDDVSLAGFPPGTEVLFGQEALEKVVQRDDINIVLSAIVGSAGLRSTWSALAAGKTVALANKESLVMGGPLLMDLLNQYGGQLLPVDSEHSAIFQCLLAHQHNPTTTRLVDSGVARLILTASGGPFRTWSREALRGATVQDALAHPTWKMGKKVTIDSATMMNKALEIIEARWLFGIDPGKISVMIHPQSLIHSMVEFVDGAVMAQMSPPDMRLPIQFALERTQRFPAPTRKMDWTQNYTLDFIPPDPEQFPAIRLGLEVARVGGTAGTVINAANEVAVNAFLNGRITFDQITTACQQVFENHHFEEKPTLTCLFELDAWARKETELWISR